MAKCSFCGQEMTTSDTCPANSVILFPDGKMLRSSKEHFHEPDGRCHDCGIKHGGWHHPGCDVERCPRCGGQIITCGCLDAPDGVEQPIGLAVEATPEEEEAHMDYVMGLLRGMAIKIDKTKWEGRDDPRA